MSLIFIIHKTLDINIKSLCVTFFCERKGKQHKKKSCIHPYVMKNG